MSGGGLIAGGDAAITRAVLIGLSLLGVWVATVLGFTVVAIKETRRMLRRVRATPPPAAWPAIAIMRPCAGLDPELEQNLISTATARYDGPRELFVLVASKDDPAWAIA